MADAGKTTFNGIFTDPWNEIFKVVFFPDRIYHAQYLNATRSDRYRYNVQEVRAYADITVMKAAVYLDGDFFCNLLRLEYRAGRLVEQIRERGRFLQNELLAWVRVLPGDASDGPSTLVKMFYDAWINAFQVEIWETLEAPPTKCHDFSVLDMMGRQRPITRVREFSPLLRDLTTLNRLAVAFRENDRDFPFGYRISDGAAGWDNDFARSHQEPRTPNPSAGENTVRDENYLITFQRGWYQHVDDVPPVRYRNAMMEAERNPDARDDNILEMRWLFQREFAGSLIFFHEVTVPPGKVEGNHQHIGSEELYFITQGQGTAYLRQGDDPRIDAMTDARRTALGIARATREVFGLGPREFWALPVRPGSMIFTKSGGMHGIRNETAQPLKFVAFLYHQ
jgi:oxalate decarboxylase/phosphoglucose isomerase-like protein (cupin superfamily)